MGWIPDRPSRRGDRAPRQHRLTVEGLDARQLPAILAPTVAKLGATTLDSRGLTVSYEIRGGDLDRSLPIGVYCATTAQPGTNDPQIAMVAVIAPG